LVLTREGPMDAMTVEVELAPAASRDEPFAAKIAGDVCHHLKAMVGVTCDVVLKAPGEIPRSQGKAVRVKDLRQAKKPCHTSHYLRPRVMPTRAVSPMADDLHERSPTMSRRIFAASPPRAFTGTPHLPRRCGGVGRSPHTTAPMPRRCKELPTDPAKPRTPSRSSMRATSLASRCSGKRRGRSGWQNSRRSRPTAAPRSACCPR